jgi:hypothetical protein
MASKERSIIERFAAKAIRLGVEELEVEYKDGYEEVFAVKGAVGFGIASLRSSSPQAASLRRELYSITKKKRRLTIGDSEYELRARIFDSFGEDAFRVQLRRI